MVREISPVLAAAVLAVAAASPCGGAPFAYLPTTAGDVVVIDTTTEGVVATIPVGETPYGVAVDPRGDYAYVSTSGGVAVIDAHTNTVIGEYGGLSSPTGIALDRSGERLYVLHQRQPGLVIIDTESRTQVGSAPTGSGPVAVAIDPLSERAYVANTFEEKERHPCWFAPVMFCDITMSVIDLVGDQAFYPVAIGDYLEDVLVHPDGTRVYVANLGLLYDGIGGPPINWTGRVTVFDAARYQIIAHVDLGANSFAGHLVLNPSGTRLYAISRDLWMIDTETNEVIDHVPEEGGGLDITPDGSQLYLLTAEGVTLVDPEDLHVIGRIPLSHSPGTHTRFIGPDVPITPPLTATFTETPTITESPTATPTPTETPVPTATVTRTPSRTRTATRTRSGSPAATATPVPTTPPPTATQKSTFPGDADCNSVLDAEDVAATITALYDPAARARCDADCNRDGRVNGADVVCPIRALAAS